MERGDRGDFVENVATAERARDLAVEPERQALTLGSVVPAGGGEQVRRPQVVGAPQTSSVVDQRVIVRHSEQINELFAAFAAAQCEDGYGDVDKTRMARVQSKREGASSYAYTYETLKDVLAATRPFLGKHGIAVMQFPFPGRDTVTIRTMLGHASGQWIFNDLTASTMGMDPQNVGSGITYLRRYALKAITGVSADDEDDDGASASKQAPPQAAQRVSQQPEARRDPPPLNDVPRQQAQQAPPSNVGRIAKLESKDDGKAMVAQLDSGFQAGTRDADIIKALLTFQDMGSTIELQVQPSADPARFAPKLTGVVPRPHKA